MIKCNMGTVLLEVLNARHYLEECSKRCGRCVKIYLHWTAGNYETCYNEYHYCIRGNGEIYQTLSPLDICEATYMRNSGSISIALCCAYGASPQWLGEFPPTDLQIETCAKTMAVISKTLDIPIDINHFLTHGEAGDNEDGLDVHNSYGRKTTCERWDLEYLGVEPSIKFDPYNNNNSGGSILRGKAQFYIDNYTLGDLIR